MVLFLLLGIELHFVLMRAAKNCLNPQVVKLVVIYHKNTHRWAIYDRMTSLNYLFINDKMKNFCLIGTCVL